MCWIQEITITVYLKPNSYLDDRYSEFQDSKTFRNHLFKIKTPLQVIRAKLSKEKSGCLTHVEQLTVIPTQRTLNKSLVCFSQKSTLGQYLGANLYSFSATAILVFVYFNPHFAGLETEAQRSGSKGISLSVM